MSTCTCLMCSVNPEMKMGLAGLGIVVVVYGQYWAVVSGHSAWLDVQNLINYVLYVPTL